MPWRQSDSLLLRSLATSRLTQLALLVLTACVLLSLLAPWLASQNPFDPAALDLLDAFTRPGEAGISGRTYWLGADDQGRDVLSAILYGLRMSVLVGGVSVLLSMLIGVGLGVLAGYRGGWVDALIMRLADVQLTFPVLLVIGTISLALAIVAESTLSYLGVGLPPTQPSLGTLIRIGQGFLFSGEWWILLFPALMLLALALSVNLVGDWLRDALDPRRH